MSARPVVHWEFWSQGPDAIAGFYAEVFDWQIRSIPEMDYHLMEPGDAGGIGGGIMKPQEGEWPAKLTLYVDVDSIEDYCERIVAAGGTLVASKTEIPGVGWMALFEDPTVVFWVSGSKWTIR